jgi:hypothetical protein
VLDFYFFGLTLLHQNRFQRHVCLSNYCVRKWTRIVNLEDDIAFFVWEVDVEVLVPHRSLTCIINSLSPQLFTVHFYDDVRVHFTYKLYVAREFCIDDGNRPLDLFGLYHLICN